MKTNDTFEEKLAKARNAVRQLVALHADIKKNMPAEHHNLLIVSLADQLMEQGVKACPEPKAMSESFAIMTATLIDMLVSDIKETRSVDVFFGNN